jgi:hypothetical protein
LAPFIVGKVEVIGEPFDHVTQPYFASRRRFKHGEHQRLKIWDGH